MACGKHFAVLRVGNLVVEHNLGGIGRLVGYGNLRLHSVGDGTLVLE